MSYIKQDVQDSNRFRFNLASWFALSLSNCCSKTKKRQNINLKIRNCVIMHKQSKWQIHFFIPNLIGFLFYTFSLNMLFWHFVGAITKTSHLAFQVHKLWSINRTREIQNTFSFNLTTYPKNGKQISIDRNGVLLEWSTTTAHTFRW